MNSVRPTRAGEQKRKAESTGNGSAGRAFAFGPRRYASKGPRRLFVAQKCQVAPVFEVEAERPGALLRVHATYG